MEALGLILLGCPGFCYRGGVLQVSIRGAICLELELGEAVCLLLELGCEPRGMCALFLV